jgi:hypothetical protein
LGIFHLPDLNAALFVSGLGTTTFTIPTINVNNRNNFSAGISAPNQNRAILSVSNSVFLSYDLSTSLGPVTGTPLFNRNVGFGTTAGDFSLTSVLTVTFQAVLVPEPCINCLLIVGLGLLYCQSSKSKPSESGHQKPTIAGP